MSYSKEEQKVIDDALVEIDNLLVQQESIGEAIKDICDTVKDKIGMKQSDLKAIAKVYHKNNVDAERERINELFDVAEKALKNT